MGGMVRNDKPLGGMGNDSLYRHAGGRQGLPISLGVRMRVA